MKNKNMKLVGLLVAGCLLTTTFVGCSKDSAQSSTAEKAPTGEITVRISNGSSASAPTVVAAETVFKPYVEEASNGRITVESYSGAILGDDTKSTEACRAGELEIASTSTAPLVGLIPELAIFDIPFLFNSPEEADQIMDGKIGDYLNEKMAEKGLVNLAWDENGFRDLTNSVRPVVTPEDLKGLKIRTMENQYHLEAWKALGASPTPMSWAEVFTALQQGIIDGQENPIPNFYAARIQEVNKYITTTGHVYSPLLFLYSKTLFDSYDAETQQILRDGARKFALAEREINRKQTEEKKQALIDEGCVVTELTAEQKKAFQDKTQSVWDSIEKKVGSELMDELKSELAAIRANN